MTLLKRGSISSLQTFYPVGLRRRSRHRRNGRRQYIFLTLLIMLLLIHAQTVTARANTKFMATNSLPMEKAESTLTVVSSSVVLFDEVLRTGAGFEHVCWIDIDLDNPNIRLGIVQAYDRLVSPDEALSSMANRTQALTGINGDYFEIHGPGRPIGMLARNGRLLQTPTNDSYYAVLGVTNAGKLTIGPEFFSGSIIHGKASYPLHEVNIYGDIRKGPILITPDLGARISVAGDTVAMLRPLSNAADTFSVQSVQSGITWLPALRDQYAIIAQAEAGTWLANHLHPKDKISVTEQIFPDNNLLQAVGGGPVVLKHGVLYNDPHPPVPGDVAIRNPITAIGVSKDRIHAMMAVFDGRRMGPWKSVGMTYREAAIYMQAHGAYNAMLFDTGGSSELVTRLPGQKKVSIINTPSDGQERPVANGLFVYETGITSTTALPCKPCRDDIITVSSR